MVILGKIEIVSSLARKARTQYGRPSVVNEAKTRHSPSLDEADKARFEALAGEWWTKGGKFSALQAFNPARLDFITSHVKTWRTLDMGPFDALAGLSILDVGCGGGILSEPLARLGGGVTGIDPVAAAIDVAKAHAEKQSLIIDYRAATAEDLAHEKDLANEKAQFDIVIASEVIEHVADVPSFLSTCRLLVRDGGLLFISTLNRNMKSYALAIVAAERILGWIPHGTHEWKKFIKPEELDEFLSAAGFKTVRKSGIVFSPFSGNWQLSPSDMSVNYILVAEA